MFKNKIIKDLREKMGLSRPDFCKEIKLLQVNSLYLIETNKRQISDKMFSEIIKRSPFNLKINYKLEK